jgi:hypothetical protein
MEASPQSLRQLIYTVLLVAGMIWSGGLMCVSQVRRKVVEVEQSSWKMMAD